MAIQIFTVNIDLSTQKDGHMYTILSKLCVFVIEKTHHKKHRHFVIVIARIQDSTKLFE